MTQAPGTGGTQPFDGKSRDGKFVEAKSVQRFDRHAIGDKALQQALKVQ